MPHNPGGGPAHHALMLSDPADTDDVVWSFVVAELDSPRWRARLEAGPPRNRSVDYALPHEERFLARTWREPGVPSSPTVAASWDSFSRVQRSGVSEDFAPRGSSSSESSLRKTLSSGLRRGFSLNSHSRPTRGTRPIPDFDAAYAFLRSRFDMNRSRGLPVLVAESEHGPYTIAEDSHVSPVWLLFSSG